MPISYSPLILVIKDIENKRLLNYDKNDNKDNKNDKNDKKENKNLKKNFSFDDFFKIHLF